MDLAVWWRARRWRALLELIDQLPDASRLREAIYNDPEQARLIALSREYSSPEEEDDEEQQQLWSPKFSEFTLTALLLREIVHNTAAAAGAKRPFYIPAPLTEVDRQLEQLALAHTVQIGSRYGFSPSDFGVRES